MFKKIKFPTFLFVLASFTVLVLLPLLYLVFSVPLRSAFPAESGGDKYYLNKEAEVADPLITTVPQLKNILKGPILSPNDPSLGSANAPVTIIAFSDFQCGYCRKQEAVIKDILKEYDGRIRLVWKDYPEKDQGSASFRASLAGRCANEQKKFWAYHDLIFQNDGLAGSDLIRLAGEAGIELPSFRQCLAEKKYLDRIKSNMEEADALKIKGVPFIYINDKELMGEVSADELRKIINGFLESSQ